MTKTKKTTTTTTTTNETTPLADNAGKTVESIGNKYLTRENVTRAVAYGEAQFKELHTATIEGNLSIRILGFLGGLAILLTSLLELPGKLLSLKFFDFMVEVLCVSLGFMVILLEGKEEWIPMNIHSLIRKYALFLVYVWGRGGLYFVSGILLGVQGSFIDSIVGIYMCLIGIIFIIVGRKTALKLVEIRSSIYSEHDLRQKFNTVDPNKTGSIDINTFRTLVHNIGIELSKGEAKMAFSHIDMNSDGSITYDEFKGWWKTWEFNDTQNAELSLMV